MVANTDWISTLLYEFPWTVVTALAIAWAAMRIFCRRADNKKLKQLSWIPLGLIVAMWLASTLVTTEREKLADALDALRVSVAEQDMQAFRKIVPEDAVVQLPDKLKFLARTEMTREQFEKQLSKARFDGIIAMDSVVEVNPDTHSGTTYVKFRASGDNIPPQVRVTEWAIRWRYEGDRWQAFHLQCTELTPILGGEGL